MKVLKAIFIFVQAIVSAQTTIKEIKPSEVLPLSLSNEGAGRFERDREMFAAISKKLDDGAKVENLTTDEKRVWKEIDETLDDYWDIIGGGCSWYCGGGPKQVTASSELTGQGGNSYKAGNAHDLTYKTAWVEGVPGYGIGEFLSYAFSPESPRITEIIIVNGYVKSEKAYLTIRELKS